MKKSPDNGHKKKERKKTRQKGTASSGKKIG
jgi:hypothetical protein